MALDQSSWFATFSADSIPAFTCPYCKKGTLSLHNKIVMEEPAYSKAAHSDENWEPDWVEERFMMMLKCSIAKCGALATVIGDTTIEQVQDDEFGWTLESMLRPRSMFPAPHIIKFPEKMPIEVKDELELAFQIFWSDAGACATKIRTSVERLMDHFGVAKFKRVKDPKKPSKGGKLKRLDLYTRIERFIASTGAVVHKDHLHALRVVGNLGTHQNDLTRINLLEAFEVYEHALDELIGKKSAQIAKLAKKLKGK
jgi:hypothetical protein